MFRRVRIHLFLILGLAVGTAHAQDDSLYNSWEQAGALRGQLQFDQAAEIYRGIILDFEGTEDVVRRAWNQLVFTYTQDDVAGNEEAVARQALTEYPDLTADTVFIPQEVNDLYDRLRLEMFGALTILKPEECQVYLDGELLGDTPGLWTHIPVGAYTLTATKDKHHDYVEEIVIAPAGDHRLELSMSRRKDAMFWVTRVGGGALVAGTIYLIASSGSGGDEAQPLASPPAPPGK